MMRKFFMSFALAILTPCIVATASDTKPESLPAPETTQKKTIKILGLGNSFLINVGNYLPGVVRGAGHELILFEAAPGGCTLQRHYEMAMLNEQDPEDPKGKPYKPREGRGLTPGDNMSLKDALTAEQWDYVTIQQSSPNSFKIETYRPYAKNLYDYIKKHAPQAEVVFHQTWPWREDHTRQSMHLNPQGYMYRELTKAYYTIASELGIRIIPVGNAFQLAAESPEWKFERDPDFDYENPKYPVLPNENNSLHGGFAWREKVRGKSANPVEDAAQNYAFKLDGSHASGYGGFLAACVWFEFFYQEDVRKIQTAPKFIGERAASLREIAHKTVTEGVRPAAWPEGLDLR